MTGPEYRKTIVLQTDASEIGIGAVLSKVDEYEQDRPVVYYSRKLKKAEKNYATVERECLAIVESIKHFEVYLTGVPFTVVTDHGCLKYLHSMKDSRGRLLRWALSLQPYEYKVIHRQGEDNGNADRLSRPAWEPNKQEAENTDFPLGEEGGVLGIF